MIEPALTLCQPASSLLWALKAKRALSLRSGAYFMRLAAFAIVSLLVGIYLAFSPAVNYCFFTQGVLFRAKKCAESLLRALRA